MDLSRRKLGFIARGQKKENDEETAYLSYKICLAEFSTAYPLCVYKLYLR